MWRENEDWKRHMIESLYNQIEISKKEVSNKLIKRKNYRGYVHVRICRVQISTSFILQYDFLVQKLLGCVQISNFLVENIRKFDGKTKKTEIRKHKMMFMCTFDMIPKR